MFKWDLNELFQFCHLISEEVEKISEDQTSWTYLSKDKIQLSDSAGSVEETLY